MRCSHGPIAQTTLAAAAQTAVSPTPAAPVADLVRAVNLPYERFTLANGLRVIVHEQNSDDVECCSFRLEAEGTIDLSG